MFYTYNLVTFPLLSLPSLPIFLFCIILYIILEIVFLSWRNIKYVFTSQRIIFGKSKQIYEVYYYDFFAIICHNELLLNQKIEIHLKNPIHKYNAIDQAKIEIIAPKTFNLYRKLLPIVVDKINSTIQ